MTDGGDETISKPLTCKDLDNNNKEPSENERVNRLLKKNKATTAAASVEPKCELLGDPLVGSSCSGTLRDRFKSLIKLIEIKSQITKKVLECIGNIVLSPPRPELEAGNIQFCDKYDRKLGDRACHAEISILSSLGRKGCLKEKTHILLNINWAKNPKKQKVPCSACKKIMDQIVADCNVDISICSKSGKPEPVKPNESYEKFEKRIMEIEEESQSQSQMTRVK